MFLTVLERKLSGDLMCRLHSRFSFHHASSLSFRTFQIDVLEQVIFVKTFLCKMNSDRIALWVTRHGWFEIMNLSYFFENNQKMYCDSHQKFMIDLPTFGSEQGEEPAPSSRGSGLRVERRPPVDKGLMIK